MASKSDMRLVRRGLIIFAIALVGICSSAVSVKFPSDAPTLQRLLGLVAAGGIGWAAIVSFASGD